MAMYGTYDPMWVLDGGNAEGVAGPGASENENALEVAAGDIATWVVYHPCRVVRFGYFVTLAFDYDTQTTEGVVALDVQPTFDSATGRLEIGRLDLEDGLGTGDVRDIVPNETNADLNPGDQLVCEVVTQAAGGTPTGEWIPFVLLAPRSDVHGNIAGWTLSALAQVV